MLINNIELCNCKIRYIGRACNLCWIGFGDDVLYTDIKLNLKRVAKYAMHIQCAFRIKLHNRIVVSDKDMYCQAPNHQSEDDFYWDVQGSNMFDYKTKELNEIFEDKNIIVKNVIITENYDISLELSNGYSIEIFNNAENDEYGEAWRFFEPGSDNPHFVVGRCGELD